MVSLVSLLIGSLLFSYNQMISLGFLIVSVMYCFFGMNFSFSSSLDGIYYLSSVSNLMIFLSCLLCFLSLMASWENKKSHVFSMNIMLLALTLVLAFSASSSLGFYVFFEVSLIPTLVLIIGWGYQPERLQAGSYMMMYTVSSSLPLLVILLYFGNKCGSMEFSLMHIVNSSTSGVLLFGILGAFLVKLPMYGVHLWLPKAHVEAPLAGSMILAGILLKLGGFGIYNMKLGLNLSLDTFTFIIIGAAMWGGFLASLMCMRQMDVKAFVAYSSVGHMSIVIAGLLLDSSWGMFSAVTTMMAHGFSSSAMFCLAYFTYKMSLTRSIAYMKGVLQILPYLSLMWFLFCCINMACPPTLNLMGELSVVPSLWSASVTLAFIMGLMVFFSAAYNMYLYSSINHGSFISYVVPAKSVSSSMLICLVGHLLPLLLILKSSLFNF